MCPRIVLGFWCSLHLKDHVVLTITVFLQQMSCTLQDLSSLNILQVDLYPSSSLWQLNHWDFHPSSLLMCCIPCALLDHDIHDLPLGILKRFLLLATNTSQSLVQLLVPGGLFTLVTPYMILMYHSWHFYACHLPLVFQGNWVSFYSTCIFYSLDTLQTSTSQGCLSPGFINHLLCLILRVQLLYSLFRYCFVQFQCAATVIHCVFFLHHPIFGGVLNLLLSMVRALQFWSYEPLDAFICIHHLLQNYTVSLVIRLSVDES